MRAYSQNKGINRILDANINRAKEGLRVCEEITRFILNSRFLTSAFKSVRHRLDTAVRKMPEAAEFLRERRRAGDVGERIYGRELKRRDIEHVFIANIQRVKESIRVLEEFSKLKGQTYPRAFKKIRYEIYAIEKEAAGKIKALRNPR